MYGSVWIALYALTELTSTVYSQYVWGSHTVRWNVKETFGMVEV